MDNTTDIDKRQYIDPITKDVWTMRDLLAAPEGMRNSFYYHIRLESQYNKQVHIAPRGLKLDFQGHLVKCSVTGGITRPPPAKRGKIEGFSDASRNRLLEKFARFKRPAHTTFVTLTYPADFPSPDEAKDNLRAFLERIRRREDCANTSGVWRIELQERGAPHFHILFFDLPFIRKEKIQEMWSEIIGYDEPFTRIEAVRTWNGIMNYCSKYIAKKQAPVPGGNDGFIYLSYLHGIGRSWGVFNGEKLPFAERRVIEFPFLARVFTQFRHIAEFIYPPLVDQEAPGFKLFVSNAMSFIPLWEHCAETPF